MKKLFAFLLLIILSLFVLTAIPSDNNQKIYPLDSDIHFAITTLYYNHKLAAPSSAAPYSKAEFIRMLEQIPYSLLTDDEREIYSYIQNSLGKSPRFDESAVGYNIGIDLNIETYAHYNIKETDRNIITQDKTYPLKTGYFIGRSRWQNDTHNPFLKIYMETFPGKYIYSFAELTAQNSYTQEAGFGKERFFSNLLIIHPANINDLDCNIPYRAFVASGTEDWSLQLGRDKVSWGLGKSSNLFLSDNFPYHNLLRFTSFGTNFKYTFLSSFFPHPKEYIDSTGQFSYTGANQNTPIKGIFMFMAHRLEFRLLKNLSVAASEAIVYQSEENLLDLRIFNPVMLFHDYYIRGNANSLLGFEFEYVPFKGFSINGQIVIDELGTGTSSELHNPNAMGYLFGLSYSTLINKKSLKVSFEGAYTDPYLYLRDSHATGNYGLNYNATWREFLNFNSELIYHQNFIGYKYGNDAIVFNMNMELRKFGLWNLSMNMLYMFHGTMDGYSIWKRVFISPTTPTSCDPSGGNYADPSWNNRNSVERTAVFSINGDYYIRNNLNLYTRIDYINIANYKNHLGINEKDIQLTLALKLSMN